MHSWGRLDSNQLLQLMRLFLTEVTLIITIVPEEIRQSIFEFLPHIIPVFTVSGEQFMVGKSGI